MLTPRPSRLLRGYIGTRHLGLVTPWFSLVLFASLCWLRPGWWLCEHVGGSLIVRAGPFIFTRWRPVR